VHREPSEAARHGAAARAEHGAAARDRSSEQQRAQRRGSCATHRSHGDPAARAARVAISSHDRGRIGFVWARGSSLGLSHVTGGRRDLVSRELLQRTQGSARRILASVSPPSQPALPVGLGRGERVEGRQDDVLHDAEPPAPALDPARPRRLPPGACALPLPLFPRLPSPPLPLPLRCPLSSANRGGCLGSRTTRS